MGRPTGAENPKIYASLEFYIAKCWVQSRDASSMAVLRRDLLGGLSSIPLVSACDLWPISHTIPFQMSRRLRLSDTLTFACWLPLKASPVPESNLARPCWLPPEASPVPESNLVRTFDIAKFCTSIAGPTLVA